jgi:hypothetical protein
MLGRTTRPWSEFQNLSYNPIGFRNLGANTSLGDIFISYSRSDRATAQTLANVLQRENWSVWWDPKIPPGKTFDEVIDQALEKAKCVIVLWSKESVKSRWVKAEAAEGNRRRILLPALIEDDVKVPLEFRYLQASRLTDWRGEAEHTELGTLRAAVSELLGNSAQTQTDGENGMPRATTAADSLQKTGLQLAVPGEVYLDPETRLMWTIQDNGEGIDWFLAKQYAEQLRLGGYSDWRLPTIDELEKLYDPQEKGGNKIRKPFRLTSPWVWSSAKSGWDCAWGFVFVGGKRSESKMHRSFFFRALCVRKLDNNSVIAERRARAEELLKRLQE